ncbi:MAG: hypothetical protein HY832_03950 [Candidatus Aenigmarchaeota archaeon]|nr:hypothetical protein [Candidatus Aenigmarchaeota archaeon]
MFVVSVYYSGFYKRTNVSVYIPRGENGNIELWIGVQRFHNQKTDKSPVDIKVYFDDKIFIDGNFDYNYDTCDQSHFFRFMLNTGNHTIKAVSDKGEAFVEKQFDVITNNTITLAHWYYTEQDGEVGPSIPPSKSFDLRIEQGIRTFLCS